MSESLGDAVLELRTDDRGLDRGIDRAHRRAEQLAAHFDRIGKRMATIGAALSLAVTAPAVLFGRQAVQAATDAGELQSAFDYSFGGMAKAMNEWARTTGDALGRSTQALQQQAFTFNQLFKAAAPTGQQAAELSKQFALLAQDVSSFFNVTEEDALQKLRAGLVGEAEPLRQFGVMLSAAAVEAKALEMGLADANGEISEQAKILARAAVITEELKDAHGDAARTAESAANQQRALGGAFEELSVAVGNVLLPVILPLIGTLTDLVNGFAALDPGMQQTIVVSGAVTAAIGPLVGGLGLMLSGIAALVPAVLTLTGAIAAISAPVWLAVAAVTGLVAVYLRYNDVSDDALAKMPAWEQFFVASARGWNLIFEAVGRAISAVATYLGMANDQGTLSRMLLDARTNLEGVRKVANEQVIAAGQAGAAELNVALETGANMIAKHEAIVAELEDRLSQATAEPFDPSKAIELPAVNVPPVTLPDVPALGGGGGGAGGGGGGAAATEADPWADALKSARAMIDAVREQTREIGLNQAQVARLRLVTDLTAAAQEKFGTVTEEARAEIAALGQQIETDTLVQMARLEEEATKSAEGIGDAWSDMGSQILDPLKQSLTDGELSWRSFADTIVNVGRNMASRLLDQALGPIEDALSNLFSGGGNKGGGNKGSGIFGRFFGAIGSALGGALGGGFTPSPVGSSFVPLDLANNFMGHYAGGGTIPAGGWGIAGEDGEEIITGPARVFSNADSRRMMAGQGQDRPIIQILTRDPDTQVRMKSSAATTARDLRRATSTGGAY